MTESTTDRKKIGAVVLCGGASRRMGFDKWRLPVGNITLLESIVQALSVRCDSIVISVASGASSRVKIGDQFDVSIVEDQSTDRGPLEGIRAGLQFLSSSTDFTFVTACDIPILDHLIIDELMNRIGQYEAVIPVDGDRNYSMTALYRTSTFKKIGRMIENSNLRVSNLAGELNSLLLPVEELKAIDPELRFLDNINRPEDYFKLLLSRGNECDPALRKQLLDFASEPEN